MSQNLPLHLQRFQAPDVGAALSANLGAAMPPHVSIGGGRFTLIDASNNEIPVPTFDPVLGVYLDAAIIDVNNVMSRVYFAENYDPRNEGVRPTCYSDNGIGPSTGSSIPQAPTCAACPHTAWTKINPNGNKVPWCTQKQKVALLIPGFPTLFQLAVPPNSHGPLREYVEKCKGNGANIADLVTRISFVPGIQGTLQFHPVTWIDEAAGTLRQEAYATKKTDALVGRNDVPKPASSFGIGTPALQTAMQQPAPPQTPYPGVPISTLQATSSSWPPQGTQPALQAQQAAPAAQGWPSASQQVQQPGPFSAGAVAPQQTAVGALPSTGSSGAQTAQSPSEPAPTRRRRRTQAEMAEASGAAQPAPAAPQAPLQAPFPVSGAPGQLPGQLEFGIGQGQPAGSNPELATMLDDFFK